MIKEIAKKLCEKSSCHHKCHDTTDCVVEDEAREYLPFMLTNEGKVSEIVRCKECKHNVANWQHDELDGTDYTDIVCDYFMTDGMDKNDFCSRGEKLLINENKSNNFDVKSNKQIEEMAKDLYENRPYRELWEEDAQDIAKVLYNAGYRKQSEGEWIYHPDGWNSEYSCSCCGGCINDTMFENVSFPDKHCPHCGAKMKGGE